MKRDFAQSYSTFKRSLRRFVSSWHFKVFFCNFVVLLILSSVNNWIILGRIPNSSDSILYIVHVYGLKDSILRYLLLPSIDMWQYGGIPVLGVGPLVPFIPITVVALLTGEVFAYKLLSIIVLAAAGGTMSFYTYSLIHSRIASFIAGVLYVWNPPMFITAITEGHFDLTWSYMLIPLLFLTTSRALRKPSLANLGIAGATFGLMLFGQAQMLLLVGPFYLIYVLLLEVIFPSRRTSRGSKVFLAAAARKLGNLGIIILLGFLLSSIRLMPLLFETPYRYSDVSSGDVISELMRFSSPSVFHALALLPSGYESLSSDLLAVIPFLFVLFASTAILAAIAVALDFRSDVTAVCFMLGVLAAFFTAGPFAPQFFQPFMWFFQYVPFYDQIRTPGRFAIVVAFFWSFLCGVTVKRISEHISARARETCTQTPHRMSKVGKRVGALTTTDKRDEASIRVVGPIFIIAMLCATPFLAPFFVTYDFSTQSMGAYQAIQQEQDDFRFTGFPIATYYPRQVYGILTNPDCYAPILTGKANLFGDGSGASKYLVDYLYYYLNSLVGSGVSYSIGKLLGLYNVKWMILHRPMLPSSAMENLLADPTLRVIYSSADNSEIVLENLETPYPLIYEARIILLLGGPESLLALAGLDEFKLNSSARWALIPAYQLGSGGITEDFVSKLDAVGFRESNLTSSFALAHGIPVAQLLSSTGIANNGWQKKNFGDLYGRWIPQNFTGLGDDLDKSASSIYGSYIVATGNADISFSISIDNNGEYESWIRKWSPDDASNLSLIIDESTPSVHEMAVPEEAWQFGWHWVNLGTSNISSGKHSLTLRNVGGASSVDSLMVIPKDALANFAEQFSNLLEKNHTTLIHVLDAHTSFQSPDSSWIPSLAWRGNTSTGRCLSTSADGAKTSAEILAPVSGNYSIAIRLLQRQQRGNLTLYLDAVKLLDFKPQGEPKWVTLMINESTYISEGYHNFTVTNNGVSGNDVDKLIMIHTLNETDLTNFFSGEPGGAVYDYEQTDPGVYTASIKLEKPSLVVFNAAFHPGWHASDSRSEYDSIPVNYFANGFYINNTGRLTLTIVFGLTLPRVAGLCMTCIGLAAMVLMIIYGKYALKKSVRERPSTARHH